MIFVSAALIAGPLFFRSQVVMVECSSRNQCAVVQPGLLFQDSTFRTAYYALWAALGTFLPLVILSGTSCGLVVVLYRSRTVGIASPDRYPCTRVTATVTAVVITYLLLVCPSTLTKVLILIIIMRHCSMCTHAPLSRAGFSWWEAWAQVKLGLTKKMINNARQLSRILVGIYH